MGVLSDLVSGLGKPVSDYFIRRQEIKAQDRQQERAIKAATVERQIELIKSGLTADMNWEMEFAKQAQGSWKDEYTLIVVSIPAIMAFIPGMAVYVAAGFSAISGTPGWYQLLLSTLFMATYGIRFWRRQQSDT